MYSGVKADEKHDGGNEKNDTEHRSRDTHRPLRTQNTGHVTHDK